MICDGAEKIGAVGQNNLSCTGFTIWEVGAADLCRGAFQENARSEGGLPLGRRSMLPLTDITCVRRGAVGLRSGAAAHAFADRLR